MPEMKNEYISMLEEIMDEFPQVEEEAMALQSSLEEAMGEGLMDEEEELMPDMPESADEEEMPEDEELLMDEAEEEESDEELAL